MTSRYLNLSRGVLLVALAWACRCPAADLPAQKIETVFGQRIAYFEEGDGPAIVLLHGMGSSAAGDWGVCIGPLAAHHRVIAPDQLGWGASDKPLIDYGIQTWVDMLGEFLRLRKVSKFVLVGESLGGWIATNYTIQAMGKVPESGPSFALPRPRKLVLVDAAGHRALAEAFLSGGSSASIGSSGAILGAVFSDPVRRSETEVRKKFESILSKGDGWTQHSITTNRAVLSECVDGKLPAISIPTLVVWGDGDRVVPEADGRDDAAKIAGARMVVIPQAGHAPAIERPDAFLSAVVPFIDAP